MVQCPTCNSDVELKPIKEWELVPKGKRKGPKLNVQLFEHCGKKFRVAKKI